MAHIDAPTLELCRARKCAATAATLTRHAVNAQGKQLAREGVVLLVDEPRNAVAEQRGCVGKCQGAGGGGGGGGPCQARRGCVGGGMLRERAASQPDTTPWTPAASCRIVWVLRCPRGAAPHSQVKQVGSLLQSKWGPCFKASGVLASTQVGSLLQRKWGPCFNAGGVLASKQVGSLLQRKWGPCFE
jgi:hypothetical protein